MYLVEFEILIIIVAAVAVGWHWLKGDPLPEGLYSTNGRLEAEQVQVATKTAGRVAEVLVSEGQLVHKGDLLVHRRRQADRARRA